MNRLQKKCFIVATGMHLLLVVILIVGPAFLSGSRKPDDSHVLTIIDLSKLSDKPTSGGGPVVPPPPAAHQQTQTAPPPPAPNPVSQARNVQSVPPKDPPKPPKTNQVATVTGKSLKPPGPPISTTVIARNNAESNANTRAQKAADEKRRADQINSSLLNLRSSLSSSTSIQLTGASGDGEASQNYGDAVQRIFQSRWEQLDNAAVDETSAKARVTISSDGTLTSARITESSGNAQVDALVQRTLDSVKLPAFPTGAKDSQRTYIINFNHTVKKLQG